MAMPSDSLERWRLTDGIFYAKLLEVELRAVGERDEADVARRIRQRLMARRRGLSVVGPTGKLIEP